MFKIINPRHAAGRSCHVSARRFQTLCWHSSSESAESSFASPLNSEAYPHVTGAQVQVWESRWGEVIRGPAWGTFLDASHIKRLGGFERIERDGGCAHVRRLTSGGDFLAATSPSERLL